MQNIYTWSEVIEDSEISSLPCGKTDNLKDGEMVMIMMMMIMIMMIMMKVMIMSPGYPGRYPNKRKCYWTLRQGEI